MDYFDVDRDGHLNYQEFIQMILPCDNLLLRSEASQKEPNGKLPLGCLPGLIERLLVDFLEKEVSFHMRLEKLRLNIQQRFDFNPINAFNVIDVTQDGYLNYSNIKTYLRLNGYFASDEEVIAIVRRLDGDAD